MQYLIVKTDANTKQVNFLEYLDNTSKIKRD